MPVGGRADRVVADLGALIDVAEHARAERARHHLRAEADAENGLLLRDRHVDPVDLLADELVGVVGALRPAENDRAGVVRHRGRQRIAETRAADVERIAEARERGAGAAGSRMLLVQDQQDRLLRLHA